MFFSFRSFLQVALYRAIYPQKYFSAKGGTVPPSVHFSAITQKEVSPQTIIFKQVKKRSTLTYSTAAAFHLAPLHYPVHPFAAQLATELQNLLSQVWQQPSVAPRGEDSQCPVPFAPQALTVHGTKTGLVQVQVHDRAIAAWLDQLLQPLTPHQRSLTNSSINLAPHTQFGLQHAHARCCSLLRLAHHAQIITLSAIDAPPRHWQFTAPKSLSWLTAMDQLLPSSDRLLINALIAIVDDLDNLSAQGSQSSLLNLAGSFSQTFDQFHRTHPMGGRSAAESINPLNLRQFGLLMAIQRILQSLLEDYLSLHAPTEL